MTVNIDEAKRVFTTLESVIKQDHIDATKAIQDFGTWYNYFVINWVSNDVKNLFFNEAIPTFIKHVLKRKYSNVPAQIIVAQEFLELSAKYFPLFIPAGFDGVAEATREILDPNQPFYQKYGYPEIESQIPVKATIPYDEAFIASLQAGDCVDYQLDDGKWVCVSFEKKSSFDTEIEIRHISEDDRTEWISLETHGHRIAPPFTKIDGGMNQLAAATNDTNSTVQIEVMDVDSVSADIDKDMNAAVVTTISLSEVSWKFSLTTGDLIDVKDPAGTWYQACIMAVKEVKDDVKVMDIDQKMKSNDDNLEPFSFLSGNNDLTKEDMMNNDASIEDDDKESVRSSSHQMKRARKGNNGLDMESSNHQLINDEVMDKNLESVAYNDNLVTISCPDVLTPIDDISNGAIDLEYTQKQLLKHFRVSYLGQPEKCDEWINLNSDRIAKLNSMSKRRRGENPLREEVLLMIKPIPASSEVGCAVVRDSCFISPYFVSVVNNFGVSNGFESIVSYLRPFLPVTNEVPGSVNQDMTNSTASSPESEYRPLSHCLAYIQAAGACHGVLTTNFLTNFAEAYVPNAIKRIVDMTLPELRQTGYETLEPALIAIENITYALYGRTLNAGACFESVWVDLAVRYISSPYLNRRLGGLKFLSILVKRAMNAIFYPNGMKITESLESPGNNQELPNNNPSEKLDGFIGPVMPNQQQLAPHSTSSSAMSFKVMPILYSVKLKDICKHIVKAGVLESIFLGDTAHESLMDRVSEIIKALSFTSDLDSNLINLIWDAAFHRHEKAAWKVLSDLANYSSSETLSWLASNIQLIARENVTVENMNLLIAISNRTRDILLDNVTFDRDDSLVGASPSQNETMKALELNISVLDCIWQLTKDGSGVPDHVIGHAINQFDGLLGLGVTSTVVFDRSSFPWHKHWQRTRKLIEDAVVSIQKNESIIPAVKLIQCFINSWTVSVHPNQNNDKERIPFELACRSSVAIYLESSYNILKNISKAITDLKTIFNNEAEKLLSSLHEASNVDGLPSKEVQNKLNDLIIPNSRTSYRVYLNKLFEFLYIFARNCEGCEVSFDIIESIWNRLVYETKTTVEIDAMVAFVRKLMFAVVSVKKSTQRSQIASTTVLTTTSSNIDDPIDFESMDITEEVTGSNDKSSPSKQTKKYLCSATTLSAIFTKLLCDRERFIMSPFYNEAAFGCTEKLFVLLNSFQNLVLEHRMKTAGSNSIPFTIIGPPSQLLHWEIFFDIALSTPHENVAINAIKLITSFPQKLSAGFGDTNEVSMMRKQFIAHCMNILETLKVKQSSRTVSPRNGQAIDGNMNDSMSMTLPSINQEKTNQIKRCLMILDEILEEAAFDSRNKYRSHGYLSRSATVTFKINGQGKLQKYSGETFVMSVTDTVEDVTRKVLKIVQKTSSDVKIMHRAKYLQAIDKKKLLSQLGTLAEVESLLLVDKSSNTSNQASKSSVYEASDNQTNKLVRFSDQSPLTTASNAKADETVDNGENSQSAPCQSIALDDLPAVLLSRNPYYINLLFELMEVCEGSLCDDIWSLLNRLPSSPSDVNALLELNCDNVSTLLFRLSSSRKIIQGDDWNKGVSIPRFLYILNIIEYLLQPAESMDKVRSVQHLFNDIAFEAISSFPSRFIAQGGCQAMLDMFAYISQACPSIDERNIELQSPFQKSKLIGFSYSILLSSIRLTVKLVRSFVVRASAHVLFNSGKLSFLFEVIESICKSQSSNDEVSKISDVTLTQTENRVDEIDSTDTDNSVSTFSNYLSKEWGWRLSFEDKSSSSMFRDSDQVAIALQKHVINLIVYLRYLSKNINLFGIKKFCPTNEKLQVERRIDMIVDLINDLIVLWIIAVTFHPHIVNLFQFTVNDNEQASLIPMRAILIQILAGVFIRSTVTVYDDTYNNAMIMKHGYENPLEAKIGIRFGYACDGLLRLLCDSKNLAQYFFRVLLTSLIDIRPTVSIQSNEDASHKKYQPMFDLLKRLLSHSYADYLAESISYDQRLSMAIQITRELISVFERLNPDITLQVDNHPKYELSLSSNQSNSSVVTNMTVAHVDGALDLLSSLCHDSKELLQTLYDQRLLGFLLQCCLGLNLPSQHELLLNIKVVCHTDDSRESAYKLIEKFCDWDHDVIAEILLYLRPIHELIPTPMIWSYDAQSDAISNTGFVGLRNLGCTCYMNSLLQALFMIPQFRNAILSIDIPKSQYQQNEEIRNNYIAQLQKLFLSLQYSRIKAVSPEDWTYCYKDEYGKPINVLHQQDAQEFLQVLFDRLEQSYEHILNGIGSDSMINSSNKNDFLSGIIGGVMCDQMLKDTSTSSSDIRERSETFICMSVDVKGYDNLQDSLMKYIQGERISDYLWEDSTGQNTRVNIIKRQCISDLSETLIFHLKRFELNFDTFLREKVYDRFSFPQELDMFPYSREALLHGTDPMKLSDRRNSGYYRYELKAIVVHTGTADSGHYFSYIKNPSLGHNSSSNDQINESKWFEFNDSNIKKFSSDDIPNECYGGVVTSFEHHIGTDSHLEVNNPNPQSAYMLIYQRIRSIGMTNKIETTSSSSSDVMDVASVSDLEINNMKLEKENESVELSYRSIIEDEIKQSNTKHLICLRILSSKHFMFLSSIMNRLVHWKPSIDKGILLDRYYHSLIHEFTVLGLRIVCRSSQLSVITSYLKNLNDLIESVSIPTVSSTPSLTSSSTGTNSATGNIFNIFNFDTTLRGRIERLTTDSDLNLISRVSLKYAIDWSDGGIIPFFAKAAIEKIVTDTDTYVIGGLFSPTADHRQIIAQIVLGLFKKMFGYEGYSTWFTGTTVPVLSRDTISSAYREAFQVNNNSSNIGTMFGFSHINNNSEQADLELALRLSEDEHRKQSSGITASGSGSGSGSSQLIHSIQSIGLRLLIELTTIQRLQLIGENWRRGENFTWLLLQLSNHHWSVVHTFIHREVVAALMDVFLGEQSPLLGTLYDRKGRKFAPSSFTTVYPVKPSTPPSNKTNETIPTTVINPEYQHLSSSVNTIPNWCNLIETVSMIITAAQREDLPSNRSIQSTNTSSSFLGVFSNHSTPSPTRTTIYLNEFDLQCVNNKTFYSTCIRQCRYTPYMMKILRHRCYGSLMFSDMICDVLYEALSTTIIEATSHIFELMDLFISIDDNLIRRRCEKLFSLTGSSILDYLSTMKDQVIRSKQLLICIYSLLHIIRKHRMVSDILSYPKSTVNLWAPWMLKFCFQFQIKCQKEHDQAVSLHQTPTPSDQDMRKDTSAGDDMTKETDGGKAPSLPAIFTTGPYLVIYGESLSERESTWLTRADKTVALLHQTLTSMGHQPDLLMPEDAFTEVISAEATPTNQRSAVSSGNPSTVNLIDAEMYADCLTDEELKKILDDLD